MAEFSILFLCFALIISIIRISILERKIKLLDIKIKDLNAVINKYLTISEIVKKEKEE